MGEHKYAYNYTFVDSSSLPDFCSAITSTFGITTAAPIQFKKVIFNAPATIVCWSDGSKTVVKCKNGEIFDREKGLAMAICKKVLGKAYRKTFKEAEI